MFVINYDPNEFKNLADQILNNSVLISNNKKFRICEIEMYLLSSIHQDKYVHGDEDQKSFEKFYFHKFKTGTFKSGTFKGVDIALGNKDTYFGILIRSIENMETKEFTEPNYCYISL